MSRPVLALAVLISLGTTVSANAQTHDALLRENRLLRERIESLQRQLGDVHPIGDREINSRHADDHGEDAHADDPHQHDHAQHSDHAKHGKGDREAHFDYCLPFEDHHGGHGYCDLCGYGPADSGGDDGHGHGHAQGPAYHHSIEGYPILHSARTEFFFVERHLHLRLVDTRDADDGQVDELEFEAEIVYALNDRLVLLGTLPVIHLNPDGAPSTAGVGDMEFGVRLLAFNGERDGVLFGLDVTTPTGDADRDLGGDTLLLPSVNWVHDFGCGTYMFNVVTWEMPIDVNQGEDLLLHDFVLLHTFLCTQDATLFRYLTPSLEINTEAVINGPASGRAVVDATLGLNWMMGDENEVSIGWSFPLSGEENFENQFLLNFIRHL